MDLIALLLGSFGAGVLLSVTPCVLPMVPILAGIIAQSGKKLPILVYVICQMMTYAGIGILLSMIGIQVTEALQSVYMIYTMKTLLVLMGAWMIGVFEVGLPTLQWHIKGLGPYLMAIIMAVMGVLVLSPCITPALVGVLVYIGTTGSLLKGALALSMLNLGMNVPILGIMLFGKRVLPKNGPWMVKIKQLLGILLIIMAFTAI